MTLRRPAMHGAIQLLANRVLAAGQAVHDERNFAAQRLEEWIDDFAGVPAGQGVLGWRAEITDASRLRSFPALAIVDAPRMDDDQGRFGRAEPIGHLDDAPRVVGEAPSTHVQVRVFVIDEDRRLEAG